MFGIAIKAVWGRWFLKFYIKKSIGNGKDKKAEEVKKEENNDSKNNNRIVH